MAAYYRQHPETKPRVRISILALYIHADDGHELMFPLNGTAKVRFKLSEQSEELMGGPIIIFLFHYYSTNNISKLNF